MELLTEIFNKENGFNPTKISKRILTFNDQINHESITKLMENMRKLWSVSEDFIILFIHTAGGETTQALHFYDTIRVFKPKLITIASGKCMSAGIPMLLAAQSEYRFTTEHTQFLIHPTKGSTGYGTVDDGEAGIHRLKIWEGMVKDIILKNSKMNSAQVDKIKSNDWPTSVSEALEYGLVSKIISC